MPSKELIDEEQRLRDSVALSKRKLYDVEKRMAGLEDTISKRFAQEHAVIAERWAKIEEASHIEKADTSEVRKAIDKEIKRVRSMGVLQIKEDERLRARELKIAKQEKERRLKDKEAISNLEKSEEIKEAAEKAKAEIQSDLDALAEKREEVELRIQTLAVQQSQLAEDQKRLYVYEKRVKARDEHSLMSEAKALSEQAKAAKAISEMVEQRSSIAELQAKIDKQMEQLAIGVKRLDERELHIRDVFEREQSEIKKVKQKLMERMVALDKREAKLKEKEKGE